MATSPKSPMTPKTPKASKTSKPAKAPKAKPKRSAGKRYHHGNLRAALVDTALAIIVEKGPRDLTLREVARRAGVSHAAPYRHFDYKEAMLAAVAEQGFHALTQAMRERANQAGDPVEKLQAAGMAYIGFAIEHAAHYRLMFGPDLAGRLEFPDLSKASKAAFSVLEESVAECQRQGLMQPGAARDFALATWSLLHGFAMLYVDGQIRNKGYNTSKSNDLMQLAAHLLYTGLRLA